MNKVAIYGQLDLCRNELMLLQYSQNSPWAPIKIWEAKWKPWFRATLPQFIDDLNMFSQEPTWVNMKYSALRALEDPIRFSGAGAPREIQIFGDTIFENLRNTAIWAEGRNKLIAFLEGIRKVIDSLEENLIVKKSLPGPSTRRAILRQVIRENIKTSSELEAFCLDYFKNSHTRFSHSMNTEDKINLLLEREDPALIAQRMMERFEGIALSPDFDDLP